MKFICTNPYKPSFRSRDSETIGFLLSYSCAQMSYFTPASLPNAAISTLIRTQYDPIISNIFDLFLDFIENFPHSIIQINTHDD